MFTTTLQNYQVSYNQQTEFNDLKREVFGAQIYYFETDVDVPIIIDGGAHLGLATLYFKRLYPQAQIIAFEPNPTLFRLLTKNIDDNQLENVELVNAALGKHESETKFYVDKTDWQWWSTGSLLNGAWNGEQKSMEIKVKMVRLDQYLSKLPRVDLLKLDIEGNEQTVLLSLHHQLDKVQQLIFEFHPTKNQDLTEIINFLEKRGFKIQLKNRKNKPLKVYHQRELVLVEASK